VADDIWTGIGDDVQAGAESSRQALLDDVSDLLSRVEETMLTNPNPDLETIRSELLALQASIDSLDTSGDPDAVWQALQEYQGTYNSLEQAYIAVEAIIPDPELETDPEAAAALQSELIARLDAVANEVNVWVRYLEGNDSANIIIAEIRELQNDIREVDFNDPLAMGNLATYAELVDYEEEDYEEWRVDAATEWRQDLLDAIDARLAILNQERASAIWLRDAYVQLYNNTLASCQTSSELGDSTQSLYDSTLAQYNTTLATYEALQIEYDAASSSLVALQLQYEAETDPIVQAELEAQILALEIELASMEAQLASLEAQLASLEAQLASLEAQAGGTADQVASCEAQLASYQAQIDSLNAQISTLTNQINQLQNLRNDVQAVNPSSSDSLPRLRDLERRAETLGVYIR
jgi:archaellum component FlaC